MECNVRYVVRVFSVVGFSIEGRYVYVGRGFRKCIDVYWFYEMNIIIVFVSIGY